METGSASPSSSVLVGPSSSPWRLAERRNRKAGSGNIFSSVNLWQLQRLFRAAGDQDAEQRAQVIWGHRDDAELAQALIGMRTRSQRRGLRTNGRDALGSHWLRAFNHLRIRESSPSSRGEDSGEENGCKAEAQRSPEPHRHASVRATAEETEAKFSLTESQGPTGLSERPAKSSSGLRRGGDPERYLHRILH
ncbi:arginine vasopressin-induced protein 1 [Kryptolebias marmoratus]|uniref:arginine vasopressin-induced protein 1 n=1 Tax=Kryptolebias marmoratus TaxID=37003 RepID=UPI0007F8A975|nr:arginine vasopressin-induced protein 1 [Kryptolebias marmoratus]